MIRKLIAVHLLGRAIKRGKGVSKPSAGGIGNAIYKTAIGVVVFFVSVMIFAHLLPPLGAGLAALATVAVVGQLL